MQDWGSAQSSRGRSQSIYSMGFLPTFSSENVINSQFPDFTFYLNNNSCGHKLCHVLFCYMWTMTSEMSKVWRVHSIGEPSFVTIIIFHVVVFQWFDHLLTINGCLVKWSILFFKSLLGFLITYGFISHCRYYFFQSNSFFLCIYMSPHMQRWVFKSFDIW